MDEPIEVYMKRIREKAEEIVKALHSITLSDGDKIISDENFKKLMETYPTGVYIAITTQSKVFTVFMGMNNWRSIMERIMEIMADTGEIAVIPIPLIPPQFSYDDENNNKGVV